MKFTSEHPSSTEVGKTYSNEDDAMNENKKEELLASFASGSNSSNVEIVFSFDTTGSMSSMFFFF